MMTLTSASAFAALLLTQFWPLTETTTATSEALCVTVQHRGVFYRTMKVERSRISGTVTLTMPGGWKVVGTPPPMTEEQQRGLNESRRAFDTCKLDNDRKFAEWERCMASKPDCKPRDSSLESLVESMRCQDSHNRCGTVWVNPLCLPPQAPSAPARREPGRTIKLQGYDAMFTDTDCTCPSAPGAACLDR